MTDFTMKTDADGVAIITWDVPSKSMNVMSMAGFAELDALVGDALADPEVKGIVITSAKKDFAGGMDLNVIAEMRAGGAQAIFDGVMQMHRVLRRIELAGMDPKTRKGGKPIAAALPGTALGIGLELPLSTHRIFAAENPKAKIGLPEIMVGIFPGGGGTTRLVRKLGAMVAAPFLLEGKLSDPKAAKAAGLIDEVVPAAELLDRARAWVLGAKDADLVKPWDDKGYKMPGGAPYHPAGFMTFTGANAMVFGKTQGVYPAAKALLAAVYEGALVPFDQALKIEARQFTAVLMNPSSAAMIRSLFINKEALDKGANRPAVADQTVKRLGVIGAGMMGAGIAYVAATGRDRGRADRQHAGVGGPRPQTFRRPARQGHEARQGDGREEGRSAGPHHRDHRLRGAEGCDLIVEAVFEDPKVKAEVTKRAEEAAGDDMIFATNTSTLPISSLAHASAARPVHRHPFLQPGRQDDAGRDHPRQEDRRGGRGQGAGFRPPDPQDADRGERRALLLRQPLHHPLYQRRHPHGRRRGGAGAGRECCKAGRHAAGPAAAG
jgi:3-hydroxyacyl-CoA dehydrogenase/enoyl-CoA hydratase/3-hydroxybutyryl-CoA epimerase